MPPAQDTKETLEQGTEGTEIFTKEFFQKVLDNEEGPAEKPSLVSFKVKAGSKPGDNYLSLIYTAELLLSSGERRHVLVKCYPNHPSRQEFNNKNNIFHIEMEVYRVWLKELVKFQSSVIGLEEGEIVRLPYPKYVFGETIDFKSVEGEAKLPTVLHPLENYIVMEDVKSTYGFKMADRRQPLDVDHICLVIPALAKIHALSWAYQHHVEKDLVKKFPLFGNRFNEEDLTSFNALMSMNIDQAKRIFDEELGEGNDLSKASEGYKKYLKLACDIFVGDISAEGMEKHFKSPPDPKRFGKDAENPEEWKIVCHGDCWSNNMLFRYDESTKKPVEVVLVDLQMVGITCVVIDLQYVIYASTDSQFRKKHLDEMLQLYHDTFNSVCSHLKTPTLPGFNLESLKFRFHRAKFTGFYNANLVLPMALKADDEAIDLEKMDKDKDFVQAFADVTATPGANKLLTERLIGVVQDMIDDGVL